VNIFGKQSPTMNSFSIKIAFHSKAHQLYLRYYSDNHNLKADFMNFLKIYLLRESNLFKLIEDSEFLIFYLLHPVTYFHILFPNLVI
jgi:hypothetical protein